MKSRIIAIHDLDSFERQNIEILLFSNILEKKYDSVNVIDLNDVKHNIFLKKLKWTQKRQILTSKVFDITSYHFGDNQANSGQKLYELVDSLKDKSELLLLNVCSAQDSLNTYFYQMANDIVIFADLNNHIINDMISFFIMHKIENAKVWLFVVNKQSNIQNDKAFIGLRRELSKSNVMLESLDSIPEFKTLDEIKNVDPWLEIYKKINSTF